MLALSSDTTDFALNARRLIGSPFDVFSPSPRRRTLGNRPKRCVGTTSERRSKPSTIVGASDEGRLTVCWPQPSNRVEGARLASPMLVGKGLCLRQPRAESDIAARVFGGMSMVQQRDFVLISFHKTIRDRVEETASSAPRNCSPYRRRPSPGRWSTALVRLAKWDGESFTPAHNLYATITRATN